MAKAVMNTSTVTTTYDCCTLLGSAAAPAGGARSITIQDDFWDVANDIESFMKVHINKDIYIVNTKDSNGVPNERLDPRVKVTLSSPQFSNLVVDKHNRTITARDLGLKSIDSFQIATHVNIDGATGVGGTVEVLIRA